MSKDLFKSQSGLRRDVGVWGSFMWGYADVGANVYVALGIVIAAAQGAASLAFAVAGLVYILIGLAYTELASAYPIAGGGQYFSMRGLGDIWGFISGSSLLLDYTIDIALFATASAGYINFFMPYILGHSIKDYVINIGPFAINYFWYLETLAIILILVFINIKGVKESSRLNEIFGVIEILTESGLVILGFVFAWSPEKFLYQWHTQQPSLNQFMYGTSLAIISFIGLESISQAAQETRRPATIIPRTSIALIFTVFLTAISFSTLGLGVLDWQVLAEHQANPVAKLADAIPYIGIIAGPFTAVMGAIILFISSNTGVMGASRLTFCMSQFGLISKWFDYVHPKFKTPVRTILVFSFIAIVELTVAFLTPKAIDTLGNLYAFGATLGYILVFLALIRLRYIDPYSPRPYKVPFNIKVKYHGHEVEFPLFAVIGTIGVSTIFFMVIWTHSIGRIAGPAWVILCLIYYFIYRAKNKLPLVGSVERNWEKEQIEVLESAEEYDLVEQYKIALKDRDKKGQPPNLTTP
ncbi:MAG: APC family permease [Candidatus Firestonebacteria bacterium]